jgi:Sec-independent protein translocase protein TatA
MGRGLMKGFKNLPDTIGNFAKGLGRAALGIAIFAIKAILIVAAIVLFIIAIKRIVSAIRNAVQKVKNFFSFGKKKEPADPEDAADKTKNDLGQPAPGVGESMDTNSVAQTPDQRASQDQKTSQAISNTTNYNTTAEENKITNQGDRITPAFRGPARIQPVPARQENVNRMSADMASSAGKGVNQVIAPTSVNNVTSNNTTQSMSRSPENADRSFINLNTVPV